MGEDAIGVDLLGRRQRRKVLDHGEIGPDIARRLAFGIEDGIGRLQQVEQDGEIFQPRAVR
ncbi:hypothetical protein D3C72_2537820 [compost metagenome]